VSIITPTRDRERLLPLVYSCVSSQDWPNIEWLIDDDSIDRSPFLDKLDDSRVKYHYEARQRSLGIKRNQLVGRSLGEYIVHFDDDDYYAPSYISQAVASLVRSNADLRKLTGTFIYDQRYERLFYWDQLEAAKLQFVCKSNLPLSSRVVNVAVQEKAERHRLGYGFSYVYKRKVWQAAKFPDWDFAEDLCFMEAAIAKQFRVIFVQDVEGLCLHMIHEANLSGCFPQFMIPTFLLERLFPRALDFLKNTVGTS
jgi:glycosyltransferase involved in cell wall biosynthesis